MIIDGVANVIDNASTGVVYSVYNSTKWLIGSEIAYSMFALIACLWLWNKIGREWSRDDFYKAGSWLIMFICLQAIYYDKDTFEGFLELIHLPVGWCFIMQ